MARSGQNLRRGERRLTSNDRLRCGRICMAFGRDGEASLLLPVRFLPVPWASVRIHDFSFERSR